MGTGIDAAIPLSFRKIDSYRNEDKYFTEGFFDNYDIVESNGEKIYTIKTDLLLSNFLPFLIEFYNLIEEDLLIYAKLDQYDVSNVSSLESFVKAFSFSDRNGRVPFIYKTPSMFSTLGCECEEYWLFYSGSYKAFLETYETLMHFEKILAKSMKNPLAKAIKFGIFG